MIDAMALALSIFAGIGLGAFYFCGLWWTIRKGIASQYPAVWFFFSLMARMGILLLGVYFVMASNWERAVACLLGVVVARIAVDRVVRKDREASNAP